MDLYSIFASELNIGELINARASGPKRGFINANSCYPCKVVKRMAFEATHSLVVTINIFGFAIVICSITMEIVVFHHCIIHDVIYFPNTAIYNQSL